MCIRTICNLLEPLYSMRQKTTLHSSLNWIPQNHLQPTANRHYSISKTNARKYCWKAGDEVLPPSSCHITQNHGESKSQPWCRLPQGTTGWYWSYVQKLYSPNLPQKSGDRLYFPHGSSCHSSICCQLYIDRGLLCPWSSSSYHSRQTSLGYIGKLVSVKIVFNFFQTKPQTLELFLLVFPVFCCSLKNVTSFRTS